MDRLERENHGILEKIPVCRFGFGGGAGVDAAAYRWGKEKCDRYTYRAGSADQYAGKLDGNFGTYQRSGAGTGHAHRGDRGENRIFRAINRLDKNTSGLVLIALDAHSAEKLKGNVDKTYTAIVQGTVAPKQGIIELPIAREKESIITRCVRQDGQYAKTEYTVVKQNNSFSLLDIKLHTGRTHQIRVHFSHLGYPLAGDDLYGGNTDFISRHALHCRKLEFVSPETNQKVVINSKIPQDMADIVIKI